MRRIAALLLSLLSLPVAAATPDGPAPLAAQGPDAEGGFLLSYDLHRASPGPVALRLLVATDAAERGERDLGARDLPAGATRLDVPFLPAEGAGEYAVALAADGVAGAPLRFHVDDAGATARVTWTVPDEPTTLLLTDDAVNADGKLKSPGEALLTRVRVEDANGARDAGPLRWFVLRGNVVVDQGETPLDAAPNATSLLVEHRYARTPLPAGEHALVLRAGGAEARRTFAIRDVPPTLASLRLDPATPDVDVALEAVAVLADRNGWNATPALEARVLRATARVPWNATLGAPLAEGENASVPLRVVVPANASPGAYRVSLYAGGVLAGSAPFEVLPLPRLASVAAEPADDALTLRVNLTAPGLVDVLAESGGASTRVAKALPAGVTDVHLPPPSAAPRLAWSLTLRAREGGPALGNASGEWLRDAAAPTLDLQPLRRLAWRVAAEGWDLAGATVNVTLTRWDGQGVPAAARFADGRLTVEPAATPEPGRYVVDVDARLANGTRARGRAEVDLAPWVRVALGEANVTGREAALAVRNEGAPLRGLVVEVDGLDAPPVLRAGGVEHAARTQGRRHAFDAPLAAGAEATLVLPLPDGPQPAGAREARVRVLALGGRSA